MTSYLPNRSSISSLRRASVLTRTFSNNASKRMAARSAPISPDRSERRQAPIGRDATGKAIGKRCGALGCCSAERGDAEKNSGKAAVRLLSHVSPLFPNYT